MVETRSTSRPMERRTSGKWSGGKFAPKRKGCPFCASRSKVVDYKDTALLNRFISDRGKIEPRRRTGTCNRHQHAVALAIKQARHVALLPFVPGHIHIQGIVPPLNINPVVPASQVESDAAETQIKETASVASVEQKTTELKSEETVVVAQAENDATESMPEDTVEVASDAQTQEVTE